MGNVIQGKVNSCYLLGSLLAIAQSKERIQKIFPQKSISSDGFYEVKFMINGEETSVIVDDLFPVKDDKFLYCQVDEMSKLWVPLIEKAWAKSHSGYSNIEYGRSSECLRDLTGAPAFEYETTVPDIIEHIQYAHIENFVMTTHSDS